MGKYQGDYKVVQIGVDHNGQAYPENKNYPHLAQRVGNDYASLVVKIGEEKTCFWDVREFFQQTGITKFTIK